MKREERKHVEIMVNTSAIMVSAEQTEKRDYPGSSM